MGAGRAAATAVGTLACAVALAAAQQLVERTGWRVDLTPEQAEVLSDTARALLAGVERPVAVTAFVRADDPRNRAIDALLRRVHAEQPLVQYRMVDLNRSPALARRYGIDAYGAIVVQSDGRFSSFAHADERAFLTALVQVTHPGRRRLYFSTGNGERGIEDRDAQNGFFNAAVALLTDIYEIDEVALGRDTPVPGDARVLIIASPRRDFPPSALAHLDAYLRGGGRVLALLDPDDAPSLGALLQRYGIVVSDDIVLDPGRRLFAGDHLTMSVTGADHRHPVSAALHDPPVLSGVRPVRSAPGGAAQEASDVLTTGAGSWRTPDRTVLERGEGEFVDGRDTAGPVSVAASVTIPRRDGEPGRLLVIGDADFAANAFLDYLGNRELFLNAVHWLAGEDRLVGRRPPRKIVGVNQLFLSEQEGESILWFAAVLQPALVLALGVAVVAWRRRTG
ncbi:MAG: Gldg family protein [Candidatus Binatia bacterium]